jgi:hypothetical protein
MNKFLYWAPRILAIAFIFFLFLFSLDVISSESSFWQIVAGMIIHNIPVFLLIVVLLIAWKTEIVGGIVFILVGLLYTALILKETSVSQFDWHLFLSYSLAISGPALLIGILFLINWFKKRS